MKQENPQILFEDTHIVVLSKPVGLLSQGDSSGETNLVDWLKAYFGRNYVGLVHRLDRNTSGAMVVAKRTKAANRLTESLKNGLLIRTYVAIVHGQLNADGKWKHFLLKDEEKNISYVVDAKQSGAKSAELDFKVLKNFRWQNQAFSLIRVELKTGRSHQIRVQAAYEGFPLLGDIKYGKDQKIDRSFGRPALHSSTISFPHPMSQELLSFEAPEARDFTEIYQP
jgi:23S rRNA pseudouridine1911/1915/1917 synthase